MYRLVPQGEGEEIGQPEAEVSIPGGDGGNEAAGNETTD